MPIYQIGIYNRFIRDKIRSGEDVGEEEAAWEDIHYFDVEADNEQKAKRLIQSEYKESKGFVIDCVDLYHSL